MTSTGPRLITLLIIVSLVFTYPALGTGTGQEGKGDAIVPYYADPREQDMPDLWTNWGVFKLPEIYDAVPMTGEESRNGPWILQFDGPISAQTKSELREREVAIYDYLPEFAYVIALNGNIPEDLMEIDHAVGLGPLPSGLRFSPDLYRSLERGGNIEEMTGEKHLLVDTYYPEPIIAKALDDISDIIEVGSETRFVIGPDITSRDDLMEIPGISYVEPYYQMELHNSEAAKIMDTDVVWDDLGLNGTGQIVAIADTGLDTGVDDHDVVGDIHLDLDNRATIVNWAGTSPDDGHSHGTHVAGSVAGNGARSSGSQKGMAPNASIYFQAIMADSGGLSIPSNTSQLFKQAYDAGARIHTNSWGSSVAGSYTTRSRDVDWFLFNYPEMIILYSAGNSGVDWSPEDGKVDEDSIGAPASAKNCVTVGAGENNRSAGGYQVNWGAWGGWRYTSSGWSYESKYPKDPINSDYLSDDPEGLAGFSSRGPTDDGRIKPDVFAPGTNIVSCRSSDPNAGTGWGVYDSYYLYMGGTSMSTPLTAGAMALVRQFYNSTLGWDAPSGALMKATMINGAMDMTPGQYGSPNLTVQEIQGRPDMHQGWGRVNLSESLDPEGGGLAFIDDKQGIETGESIVTYLSVSSSASPLRLTMAYSDAPAAAYASRTLVNDLDLVMVAPNGTRYNGNDWTGPFNDSHDRTNPVEGIEISTPSVGIWKIIVEGYNVPMKKQHYALVASGDISNFTSSLSIDGEFYSTGNDTMIIRLLDNDLVGTGTFTVSVSSDTDTAGVSATLNEVGTSGLFLGTVWTRNVSTGNSSSIQVSHNDTIYVEYTDTDPAGTFNVTAIAKDPVRLHLWYLPEFSLVQAEGERLHFKGVIDENVSAWWSLPGLTSGWHSFHDDGNSTSGDNVLFDLNLSDVWYIPENSTGNYTFTTMIEDPFLGNRTYENFILSFNGSIPRYPKNVTVQVIPLGNSVNVTWDLSNETDIGLYRVYANSTGTTAIAPPGWNLMASTTGLDDHLDITGLTDGVEYSFRVSAVDVNGNESSLSIPYNATPFDIIAPEVTMVTTPRTIVGQITFTFTGSPDLETVKMEYYNDNNSNGVMDDGDWENVGEGPASGLLWDTRSEAGGPGDVDSMFLRYQGSDEANNTSPWYVVTDFRVDNTGPSTVMINNPPTIVTRIASHLLSGTSEALGTVEVWIDDVMVSNNTCNSLGGFTFYMNLSEGYNLVVLRAFDPYGAGPTVRTYNFTLDTMDPVASIDVEDQHNITRNIDLHGYWFNSSSTDMGLDPNFTYIENLTWRFEDPFGRKKTFYGQEGLFIQFNDLGLHELELTVRDPARNTNMTFLRIHVVDTTPPEVIIDGDLEYNEDETITFEVNVTDNDRFWFRRNEEPVRWEFRGMGLELNITSVTALVNFAEPGIYSVVVSVIDGGNNTAEFRTNITIIDRTSPEGNIDGPGEVVLGIPATFRQNLTDNDLDFPDGAVFNWNMSYQEGPPENWWSIFFNGSSFSYNFTLNGYYMITLTGSDAAGNIREVQKPIEAIGDLTPPKVLSVIPGENESYQFPEDLKITINFNEPINRSTVTIDQIRFFDSSLEALNISIVRNSHSEFQIIPDNLEFSRTYTLWIGPGIRDLWDNEIGTEMMLNYTIRTQFSLLFPGGVHPSDTSTNFTGDKESIYNISIRFSNPVLVSSVAGGISVYKIYMENDNGVMREKRTKVTSFFVIEGDDEYSAVIRIQLDRGTRYNITLTDSVRDIFDYQLDRMYQWEVKTYLPEVVIDEPEDDKEDDDIPQLLLEPAFWIIIVVIFLVLILIIFIFSRIIRKRKLDRIWDQGTGESKMKSPYEEQSSAMEEDTTPTAGTVEDDVSGSPEPPSYEDLYSGFYSEEEGPTGPSEEPVPGNEPEGIEWDEDDQELEEWEDQEEDEEFDEVEEWD